MKKLLVLAIFLASCAHVKVTPEQANAFCEAAQVEFQRFLDYVSNEEFAAEQGLQNVEITKSDLYCKGLRAYGVYDISAMLKEEGQTSCFIVNAAIRFDEIKGKIELSEPQILGSQELTCPAST